MIQDKSADVVQVRVSLEPIAFAISVRELEIIMLISAGLSNDEIAEKLFVSHRTVAKHVQRIFEKLEINNRTMLAMMAMQYGLFCLPSPIKGLTLPICLLEQPITKPFNQAIFNKPNKAHPNPIKLGMPYAMSGYGRHDAISRLNGATLAIKHINEQGGIHGRPIELVTAGFMALDKASILTAYQSLLDQEVDAISAGYACYLPDVYELLAHHALPYLHTATNHEAVTRVKHNANMSNIFQLCASDINYATGLLRFIRAYLSYLPNRTIAIIKTDWQNLQLATDTLLYGLDELGFELQFIHHHKAMNWQETIVRLHRTGADLVVLASYFVEDMMAMYDAFVQNPAPMLIYGIYSPSAIGDGKRCDGVVWATTNGRLPNATHHGQFYQHYHAHFGVEPSLSQASLAYDSVQILANAWRQSPYIRRFNTMTKTLKNTVNRGINGAYYLGNDAQVGLSYPDDTNDLSISQAQLIFQIHQGGQRLIHPSPFATHTLDLPWWYTAFS